MSGPPVWPCGCGVRGRLRGDCFLLSFEYSGQPIRPARAARLRQRSSPPVQPDRYRPRDRRPHSAADLRRGALPPTAIITTCPGSAATSPTPSCAGGSHASSLGPVPGPPRRPCRRDGSGRSRQGPGVTRLRAVSTSSARSRPLLSQAIAASRAACSSTSLAFPGPAANQYAIGPPQCLFPNGQGV